jgi:hypothetical protein
MCSGSSRANSIKVLYVINLPNDQRSNQHNTKTLTKKKPQSNNNSKKTSHLVIITKYLKKSTYKEKKLFWLTMLKVSAHDLLAHGFGFW